MPATTDHPAFPQPSDKTQRIWRYMDFAKLVACLESSSLHFTRLDQLDDPFEGSLSKSEYEHWQTVAAEGEASGNIPPSWKGRYIDILLANARRTRRAVYVNCWHRGSSESEAMWRLYAPSGYGVAIQSTYERLVDVLPTTLHSGCFVGLVNYTDHERESMPSGNAFHAVLHKRYAFEHEKEVRAVVWIHDRGFDVDPDQSNNPLSLSVPVSLDGLIEAVYVSPTAPSWFAETVSKVVLRYGARFRTLQSDLIGRAYY